MEVLDAMLLFLPLLLFIQKLLKNNVILDEEEEK